MRTSKLIMRGPLNRGALKLPMKQGGPSPPTSSRGRPPSSPASHPTLGFYIEHYKLILNVKCSTNSYVD